MTNRLSLLWSNPLDPKQDAMQIALLIGFLLVVMAGWKIILKHILD